MPRKILGNLHGLIPLLAFLGLSLAPDCWNIEGAGNASAAEIQTSAPPSTTMGSQTSTKSLLFVPEIDCKRSFRYKGKLAPLDSGRKQDADALRPLLSSKPEALRILDEYQQGQQVKRWPALFGTVGLLSATLGASVGAPALTKGTTLSSGEKNLVRLGFLGGGLLLLGGSYIYSRHQAKRNEDRLFQAVDAYNKTVSEPEKIQVFIDADADSLAGMLKALIPL